MPGTVLGIGDTVVSKIRFLDSFHFGLIIASVRVCFFFFKKTAQLLGAFKHFGWMELISFVDFIGGRIITVIQALYFQ